MRWQLLYLSVGGFIGAASPSFPTWAGFDGISYAGLHVETNYFSHRIQIILQRKYNSR